ncbi:hypothetical protein [Actinomycetospora sp. NBRC 106378]|uniref:hypothetical protein n=1 Tax=Actinomycetospora sp. NBRC 106378 TaxID=3032208 RepID=UPI002552D5C1|nr:hypothetical protein [Actinomycetospora sp. NBRC 106378]
MTDGGRARWAVVTGLDDARRAMGWLAAVTVDSLDLAGQGVVAAVAALRSRRRTAPARA